jgi:hypothetical protein
VTRPEHLLSRAERHVRESEERVARQAAIVEKLSKTDHEWAAETARIGLATMETSLELARDLIVEDEVLIAWMLPNAWRVPGTK